MRETSKSIMRRLSQANFLTRYFVGDGIDIGAGEDSLFKYMYLFPAIRSGQIWDIHNGDAQFMKSIADNSYDFVHSSHCLEHLNNPMVGLKNWFRIVKPGGHLIILVPDEDLYEQGIFPSTFNSDHKWSFTIYKPTSWSKKSINVVDLIKTLGAQAKPLKIELLDSTYHYQLGLRVDQSKTLICESAIEFIVKKQPE